MKLNLEPKEVTVILQALSEKSYKESVAIINKIVAQTAGQGIKVPKMEPSICKK